MSKRMKTRSFDVIKKSSSSKKITIDALDDYCLEEILSYLKPEEILYVEQLSNKMKIACQSAWRKVEELNNPSPVLTSTDSPTPPVVGDIINRCGRFLTKISLNFCYSSKIMPLITLHCHNLTTINLGFCKYHEKDFKNAFTNMKQLKSIKIRSFQMRPAKNRINVLESLPESIEEIMFAPLGVYIPLPATQSFQQCYLEKWQNLKKLKLIHWKLGEDMMDILTKNSNLTHLSLPSCRIYGLKAFFSNFVNLEYLDLHETNDIPNNVDELFMSILDVMSCRKLKHLNLSECTYMLPAFYRFFVNLKELEELLVNDMEDVDDTILNHFRGLKVFECALCPKVTDAGIIEILRNSPHLELLNVYKTGVTSATIKNALNFARNRPDNQKLVIYIHQQAADEVDVAEANASSCLIVKQKMNYRSDDDY